MSPAGIDSTYCLSHEYEYISIFYEIPLAGFSLQPFESNEIWRWF